MKNFIITLMLFLTGTLMANAASAKYTLEEGKLHKGGKARVEVMPDKKEQFVVKLSYDIDKRTFIPVPQNILKGEKEFVLPMEFQNESGYANLEAVKEIEVEKAIVKFLGRTNVGNLKDAYKIEILPKNGKSRIEVVYHPTLPGAGWKYVKIKFLGNIPILSGYETIANLNS